MTPLTNTRVGVCVIVRRTMYIGRDLAHLDLLWGLRRGSSGAGTWAFPGGGLKPGQSPVEAAVEELAEETGIRVAPERMTMLPTWKYATDIGGTWLCLPAVVEVGPDTEAQLLEPEKCERWEWRRPSDTPAPLFTSVAAFLADPAVKPLVAGRPATEHDDAYDALKRKILRGDYSNGQCRDDAVAAFRADLFAAYELTEQPITARAWRIAEQRGGAGTFITILDHFAELVPVLDTSLWRTR